MDVLYGILLCFQGLVCEQVVELLRAAKDSLSTILNGAEDTSFHVEQLVTGERGRPKLNITRVIFNY